MIHYTDEDEISELLMGHSVEVVGDTLQLDNGTVLEIIPNEGCGGCGNGWFGVDELNGSINAIMNVVFEDGNEGEYDKLTFSIFVYAENERIKLLEVSGHDNGYYGVGYWIQVK